MSLTEWDSGVHNQPWRCVVSANGSLTLDDLRKRPTVSVPDGGACIGLSRNASYEAAKRGDLPTIRVGRRVVVPTAPLLRMLGVEDREPHAVA